MNQVLLSKGLESNDLGSGLRKMVSSWGEGRGGSLSAFEPRADPSDERQKPTWLWSPILCASAGGLPSRIPRHRPASEPAAHAQQGASNPSLAITGCTIAFRGRAAQRKRAGGTRQHLLYCVPAGPGEVPRSALLAALVFSPPSAAGQPLKFAPCDASLSGSSSLSIGWPGSQDIPGVRCCALVTISHGSAASRLPRRPRSHDAPDRAATRALRA